MVDIFSETHMIVYWIDLYVIVSVCVCVCIHLCPFYAVSHFIVDEYFRIRTALLLCVL